MNNCKTIDISGRHISFVNHLNTDRIAWCHADRFEELFKVETQYYLDSWVGDPCARWFHYNNGVPISLVLGTCGIDFEENVYSIVFSNGRHRTRWLLNIFKTMVPVSFEDNCYKIAEEIDLVIPGYTGDDAHLF